MGRREFSAYLRECLSYDPATGALLWKERPRSHFATDTAWRSINTRHAGKPAGVISPIGYRQVRISGRLHYAHRVAWMIANGDIPDGLMIDHVNGDKTDNRLGNLRLATNSQNGHNQRQKAARALPKGISRDRGRFVGYVTANCRQHFVGRFDSLAEAQESVSKARAQLHGEFANDGGTA